MQYPSAPFFKHGRHFRVEIRKSTEAHGVYRFKTLSKTGVKTGTFKHPIEDEGSIAIKTQPRSYLS